MAVTKSEPKVAARNAGVRTKVLELFEPAILFVCNRVCGLFTEDIAIVGIPKLGLGRFCPLKSGGSAGREGEKKGALSDNTIQERERNTLDRCEHGCKMALTAHPPLRSIQHLHWRPSGSATFITMSLDSDSSLLGPPFAKYIQAK